MNIIELTTQLIIFLFPLAFSPGPGNIFFAANGARFGFYSTWPANIGYHAATLIVMTAVGLGFGFLLNKISYFFEVIRYLGAGYIFYLSWLLYRAGASKEIVDAKPAGFWDGVILLLLNPKAYLIMVVLSSQFLSESRPNHEWLTIYVAAMFTLNNFIAFIVWIAAGDRLMALLKYDRSARVINKFFGIALALIAVWMLFL